MKPTILLLVSMAACGGRTEVDDLALPDHNATLHSGGAGGAAGGGPSTGDPAAAWVGTWNCSAVLTLTTGMGPPMKQAQPAFPLLVTSDGMGHIVVSSATTPSMGKACFIKLDASASMATAPPQTCDTAAGAVAVTSFNATLAGNVFTGTLTESTTVGGSALMASFALTCTRQ